MMIYVIADNHFSDYDDPKDVIHIFHRANPDTKERYPNLAAMNADMIRRWNSVVQPEDQVFSIGDFAWTLEEFRKYAPQLNGIKHFIMGNHDLEGDFTYLQDSEYFDAEFPVMTFFSWKKRDFLLVHDPLDVPRWWKGWVIHGHHHWRPKYPFIDGKNKNINVACELVEYTPVSLEWILSLNLEKIKKMNTINATPEYW